MDRKKVEDKIEDKNEKSVITDKVKSKKVKVKKINKDKREALEMDYNKVNVKSNNKFIVALANYWEFYKKNLKKTHIMIYIATLILFGIFATSTISSIMGDKTLSGQLEKLTSSKEYIKNNIVGMILKEKVPMVILTVISGVTPYFYIPMLALLVAPYNCAIDLGEIIVRNSGATNIMFVSISSVLQLFAISLAVAVGIYFCRLSTKRFKYKHSKNYGVDDLKLNFYKMKKDDKKFKVAKAKKDKKLEDNEKLNVKIDYPNIFITLVIVIILITIFSLVCLL